MSKGLFAGGKGESPLAIEAIEEIATLETLTPARSRIAGALPFAMAGAALVVGVAVFGSYMGKSASARSGPDTEWTDVSESTVTLVSRASLGNAQLDLESQGYSYEIGQQVTASRKGDMVDDGAIDRPASILLRPAVLPMDKPRVLSSHKPQYAVLSPPAKKLRSLFERGHSARNKIKAKRQAKVITDALILEVDPNDTLTEAERLVYEDLQNTEMISLIAYLLRLGTDLNKPVPEEAAEEGGQ